MLADIEQKLEKLQEPPPVKTVKPLPAPVEVPRKKRGGRRYEARMNWMAIYVHKSPVKYFLFLVTGR